MLRVRSLPVLLVCAALAFSQESEFRTAAAVLERYQRALGGVDTVRRVQSETIRGEVEATGMQGKATFVYYAKPFKSLLKVTRPDGVEITRGFDGVVSWAMTPRGASVDKDTPLEAVRRDADLHYALHQPEYFQKLEFAGVTNFESRTCYWLHGTTHWGKDNNQFYDVQTGLLVGYRFQADDSGAGMTVVLFQEYKSFGGPLVATKRTSRFGDQTQTFTTTSVTYEALADSVFDLPPAVKALVK